jgi:hypothetical protein
MRIHFWCNISSLAQHEQHLGAGGFAAADEVSLFSVLTSALCNSDQRYHRTNGEEQLK